MTNKTKYPSLFLQLLGLLFFRIKQFCSFDKQVHGVSGIEVPMCENTGASYDRLDGRVTNKGVQLERLSRWKASNTLLMFKDIFFTVPLPGILPF